jgi:hypothetical protein
MCAGVDFCPPLEFINQRRFGSPTRSLRLPGIDAAIDLAETAYAIERARRDSRLTAPHERTAKLALDGP